MLFWAVFWSKWTPYKVTFKLNSGKYLIVFNKNVDLGQLDMVGINSSMTPDTSKLNAKYVSKFKKYLRYHNSNFDLANK